MQYRILSPLFGHWIGLSGRLFFVLPLVAAWGLLGLLYVSARRKYGLARWAAFSMALAIATSTPVVFQYGYPGYVDSVGYVLLWLALLSCTSWIGGLCFALALLNHENAVFCLPIFLAVITLRRESPTEKLRSILGFAVAFLPLFVWRTYAAAMQPGQQFEISTYLVSDNVRTTLSLTQYVLPFGIFAAFKAAWLFPAAALYDLGLQRQHRTAAVIAIAVLFPFAQLIVAHDTSRLIGLSFIGVCLSFIYLTRQYATRRWIRPAVAFVLLCNLVLPSANVWRDTIHPLNSLPHALILKAIQAVGAPAGKP